VGMRWGPWHKSEKRRLATGHVLFAVEECCLLAMVAVVVVKKDRRQEERA
jgi:hypothetical protein